MDTQVPLRAVPNDEVAFAQLGDETVLLNTNTGIYFGLDSVGSRIWTLLADGLTDDQIRISLLDEYDVPAETLREELDRFLSELEDRNLVNRSAAVSIPSS